MSLICCHFDPPGLSHAPLAAGAQGAKNCPVFASARRLLFCAQSQPARKLGHPPTPQSTRLSGFDLTRQRDHLHRSIGGIDSRVTVRSPGPIQCLLLGVGGQNPKNHR